MKTPLFFIAAIAAFFALPIDFTILVSALFGAGLAAVMVTDYRRTYRPIMPALARVPSRSAEHLRLAA